ncbi:Protein of unknown function (DUF1822) [Cylindrospermum stagnale PCC 7417]|uniref:DUF1822 domain-containing protein n=1 Tax=Cylindrospermum stagnale PCC 7417 TaxID=56107 RepID=K9WTK5_9NOST|nr:DUF1822 family protein [Cylindrospermum stagnale]AFZ23091.1 Protein of unknown function (DUF1822) [Cylindrospermum stagnale PCC 7417]
MTLTFTEPTELLLEVVPSVRSQSWQNSQIYGTPHSRWCAYINQICLDVFITWVKNEYVSDAAVWFSSAGIPSFWEFVNGVGICFGEQKVLLVPSEAIDHKELEVPQEWVDIPSWAADYYLAVQITNNQEWVRVWGYTTHQELKSPGNYDPVDRTYCLDARQITKDISAFFLTYQYCREAQTKKAIASLPQLPQTQAENLVQRLGTPSVTFPRLAVPFAVWGALLETEQSRQSLYQHRQGITKINLTQWLKGIFSPGWQTLEAVFELRSDNNALGLRNYFGMKDATIRQAKLIDLGMQLQSTSVVLVIALVPDIDRQFISVRVQLHPAGQEFYLPANIKLVLRSEDRQVLQEVQARSQDNFVQMLRFDVETGVTFNIQVELNNFQITENFIV